MLEWGCTNLPDILDWRKNMARTRTNTYGAVYTITGKGDRKKFYPEMSKAEIIAKATNYIQNDPEVVRIVIFDWRGKVVQEFSK